MCKQEPEPQRVVFKQKWILKTVLTERKVDFDQRRKQVEEGQFWPKKKTEVVLLFVFAQICLIKTFWLVCLVVCVTVIVLLWSLKHIYIVCTEKEQSHTWQRWLWVCCPEWAAISHAVRLRVYLSRSGYSFTVSESVLSRTGYNLCFRECVVQNWLQPLSQRMCCPEQVTAAVSENVLSRTGYNLVSDNM